MYSLNLNTQGAIVVTWMDHDQTTWHQKSVNGNLSPIKSWHYILSVHRFNPILIYPVSKLHPITEFNFWSYLNNVHPLGGHVTDVSHQHCAYLTCTQYINVFLLLLGVIVSESYKSFPYSSQWLHTALCSSAFCIDVLLIEFNKQINKEHTPCSKISTLGELVNHLSKLFASPCVANKLIISRYTKICPVEIRPHSAVVTATGRQPCAN
jgi:hypothetical protein